MYPKIVTQILLDLGTELSPPKSALLSIFKGNLVTKYYSPFFFWLKAL